MLIAATERGVCAIQFARSDGELLEGLRREFPFATRKSDEGGLRSWAGTLLKHMQGKQLDSSLPLDIRATAFQRRVWTYLQSIPFGATRSYSQGRERNRAADSRPRRSPRLRHKSGRGRDPMPSRGPRRRQHGRLPLGHRTEEGAAGDRAPIRAPILETQALG